MRSARPYSPNNPLRDVVSAVELVHAHQRLIVFFQWCADAGVPELVRLASTIDRWTDELLAFHTTGGTATDQPRR